MSSSQAILLNRYIEKLQWEMDQAAVKEQEIEWDVCSFFKITLDKAAAPLDYASIQICR